MRSGNLVNNHSAGSLRADVTVVPTALRKGLDYWTLSTIATFALLLSCGSDAAHQHVSGLSNTPAGGRVGPSQSVWGVFAIKSPHDNIPEYGCFTLPGHTDAFQFRARSDVN